MKAKMYSSKNWLISDLVPIRSLVVCLWLFLVSIFYTQAQVPELWGMTWVGGAYNKGVIFKTDLNGNNQRVVYSFQNDGSYPVKLVEANNGMLYGLTSGGGAYNEGVLFEFNPVTELYTKKIDFNDTNGSNSNGAYFINMPGLIQSSNGKLYGVAGGGGMFGGGVLFEYDVTSSMLTVKVHFKDSIGISPGGRLVEATNGRIYGRTESGGSHNMGVLFEYDPLGDTLINKVDFNGVNGAYSLNNGLMQASNGKLYGMCVTGGADNDGVIFEYDLSTDVFTKLLDFDHFSGFSPSGALTEAANGKYYGSTYEGGVYGTGVLFEYDPDSNSLSQVSIYDIFTIGGPFEGDFLSASNGKLYGMTADFGGGPGGYDHTDGVLFEFNPANGRFKERVYFVGNNGSHPRVAELIEIISPCVSTFDTVDIEACFFYPSSNRKYKWTASGTYSDTLSSIWGCDSVLIINLTIRDSAACVADTFQTRVTSEFWGMTENNIFKTDGYGENLEVLHTFDVIDQSSPYGARGSLIRASNGKFYGMTTQGGFRWGTLFEYDPYLDELTVKHGFHEFGSGGDSPSGSLIEYTNGQLYGMTPNGSIFAYDPVSGYHGKAGNFYGEYPYGSLLLATNGKMYGMTVSGGTDRLGTIFEYNPVSGALVTKLEMKASKGGSPYGSLVQASNGLLYGMTSWGGTHNKGVLFKYTAGSNSYTPIYHFDGASGAAPTGDVIQADNGKLYGMTPGGGLFGNGVLFEYDLDSAKLTVKHHFDGVATGGGPRGTLMQAANGKLYGMTYRGGTSNLGVLFEYDPVSDTLIKKNDFVGLNGGRPYYTHLIEEVSCISVSVGISTKACYSYTSPSGRHTWTSSGVYMDTVANSWGCYDIITINLTIRDSADCVIDSAQNCLSIVSDNTWSKSSVITPTNLSGNWNGVVGLPVAATFTEAVTLGQPYGYPSINPIQNTEVISTGSAITYFRKEFTLNNPGKLSIRMLATVDDQAEIYLNKHRVALITQFGRQNFKFPAHDLKFIYGTSSNGYLGGDAFDVISLADMDTIVKSGTNELVLVIRNLDKAIDLGGFSFRMDINCADNIITQKSSEAHAQISEGLFIFPNPVGEVLNIQSELSLGGIHLFDLSGKLIYSADLAAEKQIEVNTADLPKGVYLIRVEEIGGKISTFKIIKQ